MKKKISQPTAEDEEMLNSILSDTPDRVHITGTKKYYSIRWIRNGTRRKITQIMLSKKQEDDHTFLHKITACIILNGYWKIKFFYPFLWRWLYYIKQYGEHQLNPVIETAKKKVPAEQFLLTTISAIAMKDTMMTMTRKEVESILREHNTEQPMQQQKKDSSSASRSSSSEG